MNTGNSFPGNSFPGNSFPGNSFPRIQRSESKKRTAVVADIDDPEPRENPAGQGLGFRTVMIDPGVNNVTDGEDRTIAEVESDDGTMSDPGVNNVTDGEDESNVESVNGRLSDETLSNETLEEPARRSLGLIRAVTIDPIVDSRKDPTSTENIVIDEETLSGKKDLQSTSEPLESALNMLGVSDLMDEGKRINIYVYQRLNLLLKYGYVDNQTYSIIRPIVKYIITLISKSFGIINDPFVTDKYISYLYNPLELLCIELVLQNYDRRNIKTIMRDTFSDILKLYCQDIFADLDKGDQIINKYFNLLYNKLNSLIPVCEVDVTNSRLSERFNYVFLYLTTIPAKLFIRFAELIWNDRTPEQQLVSLQNFNYDYKRIPRNEWHKNKSIPPDKGKLSYSGFLTPDDFVEYHDDILRINEISNITFDDLLASLDQSREIYEKKINRAIGSAGLYPKIISNEGEIPIQINRELPADSPVTEITFIIDRSNRGNMGQFVDYDYDPEEGITDMVEENRSNSAHVHVVESESQIGGAVDNVTFRDFLRVLESIHDIINKTYTLPGDPTSIEIITDGYIDYEDGDFSGKKIVLDFLGMFMGAVINLIHHTEPTFDFIVTSYFTYEHNKETNKIAYIQKYMGGDAIMAGYSPSELYRDARGEKPPSLKPLSSNNDIKYGIDLYAFDDIELGKLSQKAIKQIRDKAYTELFQSFPSISHTGVLSYNGWVSSEQPSSLSPFINLALTLDGTNLTQAPSQKFVTLTTSKPTKSLQSCFAEGEYDLSYASIVGKITEMLDGNYGSAVKSMTETFIKLRKELIGLLVEQGEGILSTENIEPNYPAMDSNFKLALKNPDIGTFDYNYIYAYVYKNVIRGNIEPLFLPKCMTLLNSIMMTKIIESSASKNPSKDHGWSKLLNQEICRAYYYYIMYTDDRDILPDILPYSPIEDTDKQLWKMGQHVSEFNDRHMRLIESFYQQPPITPGVFFIDYRDGTKSWGNQINGELPGDINDLLNDFIEVYAVETCFNPCFTSRPTSKDELYGIYENNCVTNKSINTGDMIYKIFAMDECHDTKPGGRTSLAVSNYIIKIADRSFKEIEEGLSCESILKKAKKIDPKNPAMRKTRSWEAACANEITGGEFENALVANYGDFTKIDKNKLGITPEKASQIRGATEFANTYNNAVFFGNENSGNAGTFVDGGTKKTVQNIHLPNICITIKDDENVKLTVIVSYKLDTAYDGELQIRMLVSLIYRKNVGKLIYLFVTHEFVLGKGISCAQIYDDIYNNMRQQRDPSQEPYSADTTRVNLTSNEYDPALAVLFVLKKTLCDWLQNFLKLEVHTKFDSRLGFSIEIKSEISISANNSSYRTDKCTFNIDTTTPIPLDSFSITGIPNVLMAIDRSGVIGLNNYLCIQDSFVPGFIPSGTQSFYIVPYTKNTKLFRFKVNPVIIPLINSEDQYIRLPYVKGGDLADGCYAPRFHLFNYINIFWDKYRSVYSPEHYRYISTLPSLIIPKDTMWKPNFCITGDILDLWISFILTKITFIPPGLPPYIRENPFNQVIKSDRFIEHNSPVYLTTGILTMSGGATKLNANNRRKRKISYSTTKRKLKNGISKKKTKKSNQKKSKMKKSSKNHKKNKVNSNLTKKKYNK
jgi:hypothetical protein